MNKPERQSGCHCRTWVDNLTGNRLWARDVGGSEILIRFGRVLIRFQKNMFH